MHADLRAFFERFHTLLGLDTQSSRDGAVARFEKAIAERSMLAVLEQMSETQREEYGAFLGRTPEPTAQESAKWLQSVCENSVIEKIFQGTAAMYTSEYVQQMLKGAPEELWQEVKAEFEALRKRELA